MPPFKNLTGQRFSRLVVLRESKYKPRMGASVGWLCKCNCGKFIIVRSYSLTVGDTRSCGCLQKEHAGNIHRKDISGQQFGRLIAIEPTDKRQWREVVWKCKCLCGNISYVVIGSLLNGATHSCGCLQKELVGKRSTIHGMCYTKEYITNKSRKRRDLKATHDYLWNDEMTEALFTLQPVCVVCGKTEEENREKYNESLHIDHVLPLSKGHGLKPGNAVVLCTHCNESKNDRSLDKLTNEMSCKIRIAANDFEKFWTYGWVPLGIRGQCSPPSSTDRFKACNNIRRSK